MSVFTFVDTKFVFRTVYLISICLIVMLKFNKIKKNRKKRSLSDIEIENRMNKIYPLDENGKRPWEHEINEKDDV